MKKKNVIDQQITDVLVYHDSKLQQLKKSNSERTKKNIAESERVLTELGYSLPASSKEELSSVAKKQLIIPSWDELCKSATEEIGFGHSIEELFSEDELTENKSYLKNLSDEYNSIYKLDKFDIAIAALASIAGSLTDILLVGVPEKTYDGIKGGPLSNYIRDYFDAKFPEDEMQKLANSKISKVPFDAQDNRHTTIHVEGLSAYYHRLISLGHDPILGFIFGVADILNGTMTTIDKTGKIVCQVMENYEDRKESDVFSALCKLIIHFKSDITTSMGLPAPLMSLFNLLQFGNIGDEDLTIAELVQSMYGQGYDFVHFCSMSVPTMIIEIIVRLGYFIKRKKEGCSIKEALPIFLNREIHPKLGTMLFIAHSGAAAINAGKVCFTKNPLAINYPQWIAFAKYTYKQAKWVIINKQSCKNSYIDQKITQELRITLKSVDETFNEFAQNYIIVME